MRYDWVKTTHEEIAAHFAVRITEAAIDKNEWYWSNIHDDVKFIVQNCQVCAADKAPIQPPRSVVPTEVERPLQRSGVHPRLSFYLEPLVVPLLDPAQWRRWREHFVDLSVCLFGVRITWTKDEEHREWFEYLELMIVQAWRTDVEGDLLGFLFGSVCPSHRQPITLELTVPLAQLADDLPLEIVSQSDDSPVPHVLTRTLTPYLQWSACLEEPGTSRNPPSQRDYLDPREIIDLDFFQDRAASEDEEVEIEEESAEEGEKAVEEDEEEETPEEGSYSEHSEGEQSEEEEEEQDELELEESEWEISAEELERTEAQQAEDPEAVRKRGEIAVEKRQLEFASGANLQIVDDPARDLEPPKPEDGDPAAEISSAPARWRRSRSPSPSASDRPSVRARTDMGHRASSPVVIPPSP
ncbi:hypothetical protein CBR_g46817 [Chara braunii]|uniref:Integrase zinc-binding domain-containing protein n=1 Tax=Chara braunii TaxID=69332 RepID=A0A388M134_CHABU|nr:hypothetical protein CBR_g46817 [Chara braunii]|eukprot:GBG88251.1 hypothetical protein CBR_g46817 [Chara braunii]